jgi:hypothetical protein
MRPIAAVLLAAACGADAETVAPPVPDGACVAGERPEAGACVPAGAGPCAAGFEADGRGCRPILPEAPCADGEMALAGETACRPIASCGEGTWGDIPVEDGMQYVDGSFGGTPDGTATAPWPTLQEALIAAGGRGGLIAIAAGDYDGEVVVGDAVRLHGRCPSLVTVHGVAADRPAIFLAPSAASTVIRSLAVTGVGYGIAVNAVGVRIESVWVHDTGLTGVVALDGMGAADAVVVGTLVERASQAGLFTSGAPLTVESTMVRATRGIPGSPLGTSVGVVVSPMSGVPGTAAIRGSILTSAVGAGIAATGGSLTIESSAVLDTDALPSGEDGSGILAIAVDGVPATLAVIDSVVERSHEAGIVAAGAVASIERTTVRTTGVEPLDGSGGVGIALQQIGMSPALVRSSFVDDSEGVGLLVVDGNAVLESTAVDRSGVALETDGIAVVGIERPSGAAVSWSRVARSARAGISSFGAAVSIAADALECNAIHLDGERFQDRDFLFEDLAGNACGCDGAATPCKVFSTDLEPPGEL